MNNPRGIVQEGAAERWWRMASPSQKTGRVVIIISVISIVLITILAIILGVMCTTTKYPEIAYTPPGNFVPNVPGTCPTTMLQEVLTYTLNIKTQGNAFGLQNIKTVKFIAVGSATDVNMVITADPDIASFQSNSTEVGFPPGPAFTQFVVRLTNYVVQNSSQISFYTTPQSVYAESFRLDLDTNSGEITIHHLISNVSNTIDTGIINAAVFTFDYSTKPTTCP